MTQAEANDTFDTFTYLAAALGAGYLLGGSWKTAVGALLVQFLVAKNTSAVLRGAVKIAKYMKTGG